MVPAGNKAKYLSLVNHTTKKINPHQHHHHHHHHHDLLLLSPKKIELDFGHGLCWPSFCPNRVLKEQFVKVLVVFFSWTCNMLQMKEHGLKLTPYLL